VTTKNAQVTFKIVSQTISDNGPPAGTNFNFNSVAMPKYSITFNANSGTIPSGTTNPASVAPTDSCSTPSVTRTGLTKTLNINSNEGSIISGGNTRTSTANYTANG